DEPVGGCYLGRVPRTCTSPGHSWGLGGFALAPHPLSIPRLCPQPSPLDEGDTSRPTVTRPPSSPRARVMSPSHYAGQTSADRFCSDATLHPAGPTGCWVVFSFLRL